MALSRSGVVAGLAFAAGLCWLAPVAVGWLSGPPPLRAAATVAEAFTLPLLAHLALASTGRLERRRSQIVLAAAYAWAALSSLGLALARDPFYDPSCWADCDGNAFLLRSWRGLIDAILAVRPWMEILVGVAVVALGVTRLHPPFGSGRVARPRRDGRGRRRASFVASGVRRPLARIHSTRRSGACSSRRSRPSFSSSRRWSSRRVATAIRRRRSDSRIVGALDDAPAPDVLERTLGGGLGDPGLRLVFSLPEDGRCVDVAGRDCGRPAPARGRRVVTPLVREREPVAWIDHDAAIGDAIEPSLTPAVRLAIDNARLRLGLAAQLRELRIARRRIVRDGDDERRRLERDLHDGVQQQLLALGAELRAGVRLARDLGHAAASSLEAAVAETAILLDEVRELAHGVYPAILTDAGLGPALASLADVAGLPVRLTAAPTGRYPASVEATAYRVVAEGVENAGRHSDATMVEVGLREADDAVVVDVHDDGQGGATVKSVGGLAELVDRVGAIDGTIAIQSPPGEGTTIRAVIPCAS